MTGTNEFCKITYGRHKLCALHRVFNTQSKQVSTFNTSTTHPYIRPIYDPYHTHTRSLHIYKRLSDPVIMFSPDLRLMNTTACQVVSDRKSTLTGLIHSIVITTIQSRTTFRQSRGEGSNSSIPYTMTPIHAFHLQLKYEEIFRFGKYEPIGGADHRIIEDHSGRAA